MSSVRSPRRFSRLALPVLAFAVLAVALPYAIGAATLRLPSGVTKQQAYTMYGEQLDSQASIDDLVGGDITQFSIVKRSVNGSSADLTMDVTYANGLRRRGVMRMFKAGSTWYFKSINSGTSVEAVAAPATADVGVVNTILAEQAENASISQKFISGAYKRISIGKPSAGYNSVDIPVTFAGGSGKQAKQEKGRVTCITKTIGGEQVWFITGFAK